jgi:hypothetical protein
MTASEDGKRSGFLRQSSFLLNSFSNFLAMTASADGKRSRFSLSFFLFAKLV